MTKYKAVGPDKQTCRRCELTKPFEEFPKSSRSKTGYDSLCKECDRARTRSYYAERGGESVSKKYRDSKSPENIEYQRQYREANKEVLLEKRRLNVEHKKEIDKTYAQRFPEKIVAKSAKRRAIRQNATPAWANKKYIDLFYQMAKDEQVRTGRPVHVDHIVPLKSKYVCGLHTEDNLQLLFGTDNMKKSNVTWPDMW